MQAPALCQGLPEALGSHRHSSGRAVLQSAGCLCISGSPSEVISCALACKHIKRPKTLSTHMARSLYSLALLNLEAMVRRWCIIRLCDPRANTTCLLKVLELCKAIFEQLELHDKQLTAAEAACFLPCLVEKSGHNAVRLSLRQCK